MRALSEQASGAKYRSIVRVLSISGWNFLPDGTKLAGRRVFYKMEQKEQTRIGRPRGYDPDIALSAALGVFWDKGFAATSLDDLTAATAMNRPSLYAAFGDKRAIYAKALAAYKAASRRSLTAAMGPQYSLREAIGNVYRIALDSYVPKGRAGRGCFMIGSALTEAVTDPIIRKDVSDGLKEIEKRFADRFRASRGELV